MLEYWNVGMMEADANRKVKFSAAGIAPILHCLQTNYAPHGHLHGLRGQFDRAIESVATNLVKAARLRDTDAGVYSIEYSLGSVLECHA